MCRMVQIPRAAAPLVGEPPRVGPGIFDESTPLAGGKDELLPAIGATASCDVSVVVLESSP